MDLVPSGDHCQVRDTKSGYMFDLSSLKGTDYSVQSGKYTYHLSVCGGLQRDVCTHKDSSGDAVASCQVDGNSQKIGGTEPPEVSPALAALGRFLTCVRLLPAGMATQVLSYVGDQLILNYTGGETCHKIYQRSTEIYFSCHPDQNPVSV